MLIVLPDSAKTHCHLYNLDHKWEQDDGGRY